MIAQHLTRLAKKTPDKVAFTYAGKQGSKDTLTYLALHESALEGGESLQDQCPSDGVIFIAMRQSIEFLKILFGAVYSGRTFLPTYPIRNQHDIARLKGIAQAVRPSVILVDETAPVEMVKQVFSVPVLTIRDLKQGQKLPHAHQNQGVVFLQCSSGTTRLPKAIEVTAEALGNCLTNMATCFDANPGDIGCSWLPPYHDMGLIGGIFLPIYTGFTTHLMPSSNFMMNPLSWLELASKTRATITVAPNIAYALCVARIKKYPINLDLSSVRLMINSAQMIYAQTLDEFTRIFEAYGLSPKALRTAYGLAEATLMVTCTPPNEFPHRETFSRSALRRGLALPIPEKGADPMTLVSSGQPLESMEVRSVDPEQGVPLDPYHVGEIWVSGNSLTLGYYRNQVATAEVFDRSLGSNPSHSESKKYIATGDMGFLDENRNLYVLGRRKDFIKGAEGEIAAEEIEALIETTVSQDPSYRCAALMISRSEASSKTSSEVSELVILREIERGKDPMAQAHQLRSLIQTTLTIPVRKILYLRRGEIPTTTSGKVKRHVALVLYQHRLLDPLHLIEFEGNRGID
jgi:acyl-CoA synthetase (AMP-forming)/AMP-acid ligase II